jgi:hypothetical protein
LIDNDEFGAPHARIHLIPSEREVGEDLQGKDRAAGESSRAIP